MSCPYVSDLILKYIFLYQTHFSCVLYFKVLSITKSCLMLCKIVVCGITRSVPACLSWNCVAQIFHAIIALNCLSWEEAQKRESWQIVMYASELRQHIILYSDIDISIVGGLVEHMSSLKRVTGATTSLHNQISKSKSMNLTRGACNELTKCLVWKKKKLTKACSFSYFDNVIIWIDSSFVGVLCTKILMNLMFFLVMVDFL